MLKYLAGDVQAQVGGIHDAADELEVVVDELVAVLHYENAVAVELDALFRRAGDAVVDILAGDEKHRLVGYSTLGVDPERDGGVGLVAGGLLIPFDALLVRDLGLRTLPDGHHGVDRLGSGDVHGLHDGLAVLVLLAGGLLLLTGDVHDDGPAHIVGILLDKHLELPYLEVRTVDLLLGVLFYVHNDVGAGGVLVALGDRVAVSAGALPADALFLAVLFGDDGDLVGHHEGGIKAHAELSDDGDVVLPGLLGIHFALELVGAALGDDAEVLLGLVLSHADAVVGNGDGALVLVDGDADAVIRALKTDLVVGQGQVAELVDSVRRV